MELGELVQSSLSGGDVYAPVAPDEGLSSVGGALADARDEDTTGGKVLSRVTLDRVVDGDVLIGPNREAAEESKGDASAHTAVVLASGASA